MKRALYTVPPVVFFTALVTSSCSSPDTTARVDAVGPSADHFDDVAQMLVHRCGSIDCHGSIYRNMRLYGYQGTRLEAGAPDTPPLTSADEVASDYQAVVGLEPEIMASVVADKGAGYDRLSLIRKGRNTEAHKGGQRLFPGRVPEDPGDRCLTTWLSNSTDVSACRNAQIN